MTVITKPWHAFFYALALCFCVSVMSFNYSTVELSRIHRDLIIAEYKNAALIEIAKIQTESTKHYAIAEVWGCR